MEKVKVIQQVLDPRGSGGVSAEYRALQKSSFLQDKYELIPVILESPHKGISLKDISFYYQEFKKYNPDIIHIRGAAMDALNAAIAAKLSTKGRILVTVHGMYSDLVFISEAKRWISKNIVERCLFLLADGISCVCKTAQDRPYFYRWKKKMLPFVYNRMPSFCPLSNDEIICTRGEFGVSEHDILGLYVGRITKEKGLAILLDSFSRLSKSWPSNLKFLVVGDGPFLNEFQQASRQISNNIIFAGERLEVARFYQSSDFFVQPSLHENHSVSLLEACSANLPVIATSVGGNPEIIEDGITGILIPPRSSSRLSGAILQMMNGGFRMKLRQNMIHYDYSKFSDDLVDKQLNTVYNQILR